VWRASRRLLRLGAPHLPRVSGDFGSALLLSLALLCSRCSNCAETTIDARRGVSDSWSLVTECGHTSAGRCYLHLATCNARRREGHESDAAPKFHSSAVPQGSWKRCMHPWNSETQHTLPLLRSAGYRLHHYRSSVIPRLCALLQHAEGHVLPLSAGDAGLSCMHGAGYCCGRLPGCRLSTPTNAVGPLIASHATLGVQTRRRG
jgi:hypothetical protein